jgi:hypothetical protein
MPMAQRRVLIRAGITGIRERFSGSRSHFLSAFPLERASSGFFDKKCQTRQSHYGGASAVDFHHLPFGKYVPIMQNNCKTT